MCIRDRYMGTRTGAQIRSHAQKYYNKKNKHHNGANKGAPPKATEESSPLPAKSAPTSTKDSPLYSKILSHITIVESLQRILHSIDHSPKDFLAHIELTQGEKLCEMISADARKALPLAESTPELHTLLADLVGKLNSIHGTIFDQSPRLKEKSYYRYLADLL
eukprot:TRINITY_DN12531_c0_g6_i2.p1 TRINITY_DN12531_c0_g6~~TRINITY_DN12531_c0_g6_i2.p1  ORF type:complete len:163 (+),score=41.36 TRINITY_DN12531_c0_g6_i2:69-557(+)